MPTIIDLTHTLHPDTPNYLDIIPVKKNILASYDESGYNLNEFVLNEHVGTHFDAPRHFTADGMTVEQIPAEDLCVPLAVLDIADKAQKNPDAEVRIEDVLAWESEYGRLPERSCIAMYSGWEKFMDTPKYRNADEAGMMHFPSFGSEVIEFLLAERNVVGIAVDVLSIDVGQSKEFPVHRTWLPAGKWAVECVANLKKMPPVGGMIIVGVPKIKGSTGFSTRVFGMI